MKKKILVALMAIVMTVSIAGCGNMSMGFGNFEFKKIHVDTYHYNGCFTIEKWYDSGSGIEVNTKEAGSIFLAEGMYMLIEKDCPFCELEDDDG